VLRLRSLIIAALALAVACAPTAIDPGEMSGDGDGDGPADDPDGDEPESEPPPTFEVAFSQPQPDGSNDPSLENQLSELLELAVPGSQVRVALFHITRVPMAEAFVAAAERGVDVDIVLDADNLAADGSPNAAVSTLIDGLGAGRVTWCADACIGVNINHNKIFLFSELADGSRDVVVQSSANLTSTQRRLHNNAVVIRGDATLYAGYLDYWADLQARRTDTSYYRKADGDLGTRLYMYPRASGDTVLSILGNVDCFPGSEIHLAMSIFTAARVEVARELGRKASQGCEVRAAVNLEAPGEVVNAMASGGVDVIRYPTEPGVRGIHSKYLLVSSRYFGSDEPQKIVWTGSHNYSGNALRNNDETILKIADDGVYDAFRADWEDIATR
jgi:phosphatidylserine/phosphatidylglycerophosphate/cardiolipin synthase-like enzyme